MLSANQVPIRIEYIANRNMGTQESLWLPDRFELSNISVPSPSSFMRLLSPLILILPRTVDRLWCQVPMRDTITAQLVCHDLPGLTAM